MYERNAYTQKESERERERERENHHPFSSSLLKQQGLTPNTSTYIVSYQPSQILLEYPAKALSILPSWFMVIIRLYVCACVQHPHDSTLCGLCC